MLLTPALGFPFTMHALNQHDILVYHKGFHPKMVSNILYADVVTLLNQFYVTYQTRRMCLA